jgi:hypothetical protein
VGKFATLSWLLLALAFFVSSGLLYNGAKASFRLLAQQERGAVTCRAQREWYGHLCSKYGVNVKLIEIVI